MDRGGRTLPAHRPSRTSSPLRSLRTRFPLCADRSRFPLCPDRPLLPRRSRRSWDATLAARTPLLRHRFSLSLTCPAGSRECHRGHGTTIARFRGTAAATAESAPSPTTAADAGRAGLKTCATSKDVRLASLRGPAGRRSSRRRSTAPSRPSAADTSRADRDGGWNGSSRPGCRRQPEIGTDRGNRRS